ncbi:MAG TPA: methylmalonyl-CoA mutase family protein [Kofleriaceae bacterium]
MKSTLEQLWAERAQAIAKRKEMVLGVNEFANLDEKLPAALPASGGYGHRDGEAFEALRARVEGKVPVALVTLGPPSEYRGRLGYAHAFFAVAGWRAVETGGLYAGNTGSNPVGVAGDIPAPSAPSAIACICGSDERYAAEAAAVAQQLKAAGYAHVVLAGKPGALEKPLRAAGIDTFIFIGCDVAATLGGLA